MKFGRVVGVLSVLALGSCMETEPPPTPARAPVARFVGSVDANGKLEITMLATRDIAELPIDTDPVAGDGPDDTVELVTSNVGDTTGDCGRALTLCADVTVRSHHDTEELRGVTVVLTSISDVTNSAFGTNTNSGYAAALSAAVGLWRYGTLTPAAPAATRTWKFNLPAASAFTFTGEVWGEVVPGGTASEDCDAAGDDDGDGDADCNDADCATSDQCQPEVCGNGFDDDGDGPADCADADCSLDPAYCDQGGGGGLAPDITGVDHAVIAHGGDLVLTGINFTGTTSVTIGGTPQSFNVDGDTQITVSDVLDATSIGSQTLTVVTGLGLDNFDLTVIHLVISEVDSDQTGVDTAEFVEISAGVAGVNLTGYVLVHFNGNAAGDASYYSTVLDATTDANGLILVGVAALAPDITFAANSVQNGPDGVALYQAAAAFPSNTPATTNGLIDAVVYTAGGGGTEPGMMSTLGVAGTTLVETLTTSSQRCTATRLSNPSFSILAPTPDAPNGC